ncbi:MAG: response regulator, partial [Oscillospiraceae bacterium]|nr:response regulator [Oscillospiraceae bacterium]
MKTKTAKPRRALYTQLLFTAISFIVMAGLSYAFMSSIVRANMVRNASGVLDSVQGRVATRLHGFEVVIENFAEEARKMVTSGESAENIAEYISSISHFMFLDGSEFSGIQGFYGYFETLAGGPVFINGGNGLLAESSDPEQYPWYRQAVDAGGATIETVPCISGEGKTVYTCARSIQDDEGNLLGVVCMDVRIDELGNDIVNTALDSGGYGMLINQDYIVMFHPNRDFVGKGLDDADLPVSVFADELRWGEEVFEQPLLSYKNEEAVAFFRALPNGWNIALVSPRQQYYSTMTTMAVTLCALGITLAAILSGILISVDAQRAKSDDESKKKSMFLANMSHEIRTPINAIVGMTAIGRTAGTTERKDYCFSRIDSASKHLLGVINDILDMSKIEAGRIELSDADFSFEKMLQQAVNVANFRVDEKRQKLTVQIDKAIPSILRADDQRLAQVITNLLSNAVKFTPDEGSISLRTALVDDKDGVCTIRVEVADTGIGISPEQQAKLFQTFRQAESSTTRKYGGTGLGLAISKRIVEMMGGRIWVESESGRGTTMIFTVKVRRGDESLFDLSRIGINWENVRVLAVDDDPDILLYFKDIMTGLGAGCDVAQSAEDAMRLVEEKSGYNIYFVDLRMPDVDGISLTRKIREKEQNSGNSVVIMISSADISCVEREAKMAGVNRFLLKPLFPSAVADVISECIGMVNEKIEEASKDIGGIFKGCRILFAEDVDINREIVLTLLEPTLIQVDCASNGLEALNMFKASPEKYDMIFMDVQMPEMD